MHLDGITPRLLGQEGELDSLDRLGVLDAGFNGHAERCRTIRPGTERRGPCILRQPWRRRATEGTGVRSGLSLGMK